jgi:hypothetical protein
MQLVLFWVFAVLMLLFGQPAVVALAGNKSLIERAIFCALAGSGLRVARAARRSK